jgi:hypothetical protein
MKTILKATCDLLLNSLYLLLSQQGRQMVEIEQRNIVTVPLNSKPRKAALFMLLVCGHDH